MTQDQQDALQKIQTFLASRDLDFLLEGGAGVGKTWLIGKVLQGVNLRRKRVACAAVTHKAVNVIRAKLDGFDVPWEGAGWVGKKRDGEHVLTGTTAAMLGIGPNFEDERTDAKNVPFARVLTGFFERVGVDIVVVDEVSMVPDEHFALLRKLCKEVGAKILAVGDFAQLPPVNATKIDPTSFAHSHTLNTIVRQAEDSAIVLVGQAMRNGTSWEEITGAGIQHTDALVEDYLDGVETPSDKDESDRSVYIAYTNARVNAVQDRACRKLYGHGFEECAAGERVIAARPYGDECMNQDELLIEWVGAESDRDPERGVPITVRRVGAKDPFMAYYLTPRELANPHHPYNVELARRLEKARGATAGRGEAWRHFYAWRDETVLAFRHPFAITSHKSQGSTYHTVFADTADLKRFDRAALYVAVTRPRALLVLPTYVPLPLGINPFTWTPPEV